jgi:hypothetical protein
MNPHQDLSEFSRADLEEIIDVQQNALDELRSEINQLEARQEAHGRQLAVLRTTVAGDEDAFWDLPRGGEGYDIVGRLEQYHATLDGFAERLNGLNGSESES